MQMQRGARPLQDPGLRITLLPLGAAPEPSSAHVVKKRVTGGAVVMDPLLSIKLFPLPPVVPIVVPVLGCAVENFKWSPFIERLNTDNIVATLTDPSNNGVQWNLRAYPIEAFTDPLLPNVLMGHFGFTFTDDWRYFPVSLIETLGQPDFGENVFTDIGPFPPYDYLLSKIVTGGELGQASDSSIAVINGSEFTITIPGLAGTNGFAGMEWECKTGSDSLSQDFTSPVCFEHWLSRNPAASTPSKGFSGFTHYIDLTASPGFVANCDLVCYVKLDVYRHGIIDVERSIDDPNFDIAWMRAGLIITRNGANYDIQLVYNGAAIATASIPFTEGLDTIEWLPRTFEPTLPVSEGFVQFHEDFGTQVKTDTGLWSVDDDVFPVDGYPHVMVDMACVKYGYYIKPSIDNTSGFINDVLVSAITDPAYPLT